MASAKLDTMPISAKPTAVMPATTMRTVVRRANSLPHERNRQASGDLRAGNDRGRQTGDAEGVLIAIQLQQVGLHRIEGVDADTGRERGREHQPPHGAIAKPVVDRRLQDPARLMKCATSSHRGEAQVFHDEERRHERGSEYHRSDHVWHAEVGGLRNESAGDGSCEHRRPGCDLSLGEHRLEVALEPCVREAVDQPCVHRAREEREAKPYQHRRSRPSPERGTNPPHQQVQQRGHQKRRRAEQERHAAAASVRDDTGRDFEEDLARGEERVGGKRLDVAQSGGEEEQEC